jgi:hypothetical protein
MACYGGSFTFNFNIYYYISNRLTHNLFVLAQGSLLNSDIAFSLILIRPSAQ